MKQNLHHAEIPTIAGNDNSHRKISETSFEAKLRGISVDLINGTISKDDPNAAQAIFGRFELDSLSMGEIDALKAWFERELGVKGREFGRKRKRQGIIEKIGVYLNLRQKN